jgi:hypothetical protein
MGRFECFVGVDRGAGKAALGAQEQWREPVKVPPPERNCLECVN